VRRVAQVSTIILVLLVVPIVDASAQRADTLAGSQLIDSSRSRPPDFRLNEWALKSRVADSVSERRRWPFVLGGGIVGGVAGALAYQKWSRESSDGDFGGPFSAIVLVGSSAAVGALGGFLLARLFGR
jgi:hypothetical protein